MKKTITLLEKSFRLYGLKSALFSAVMLFSVMAAFGQYVEPKHYFGCSWNNTNYYAQIEEVTVEDDAGNLMYQKAGDGCNQTNTTTSTYTHHYNKITSTASFQMTAGSWYTVKAKVVNPSGLSTTYGVAAGVWIDFNADGDFADPGEFCGTDKGASGHVVTVNFQAPCDVSTSTEGRMRIRSTWNYPYSNFYDIKWNHHSNQSNQPWYYGETEDYTCDFKKPSGVSADFFVPDTAYVNTIVNLVNSSTAAHINNWDVNDDGVINYTTRNAVHVFNATGTFDIKLQIENCAGKDSIVKKIVIVNPTA
ncbi:MAG: hypothetical protein JXR19_12025, partial [Bacteroidia bacterium]